MPRHTPAQSTKFITIVTFGRSGSTALQAVLNAHPDVIVRGENYNALTGIWQYWSAVTDAADRHHAGRPNHPWFGTAKLDARAALEDLRQHVCDTILRPKPTTRWSGFKEVRYEKAYFPTTAMLISYLLFLQELFPGLRYLVNTRDPQSAALSGWWKHHPDARTILTQTNQQLREVNESLGRLCGPDRVQLLDYEEWRNSSSKVYQALSNLGFEPDRRIVDATLGTFLAHGQASDDENHNLSRQGGEPHDAGC